MLKKIENTPEFFNSIIELLKKGRVIAIPTDTIYGFAVDGTKSDTVKKLINIKGRGEKPFTFFMSRNNIKKYAVITKKKIFNYFIPGSITIILNKRKGSRLPFASEKIGVRIPQTDFIIKLLSLYANPLAVTSANLSGQEPLDSAVEIAEHFTGIDLVIDGGRLSSRPSTVLDLTTTPPTLLRKGKIPILEIEKIYGKRIRLDSSLKFNVLFVCSANTCRSPMAEGIFKTLISDKYCEIRSAGTLPMSGMPAAQFSIDVVKEYSGSIVQHQTKMITKDYIEWADLILVMAFRHYDAVLEISPDAAIKTFLLKEYKRRVKFNEVPDPVGKGIDIYRQTAKEMLPSLKIIARNIKKRFKNAK
jgi:tRNA threonylcarbamoyl adenosine modification protein (Sua5/YciO/YrdC/YwlC family)